VPTLEEQIRGSVHITLTDSTGIGNYDEFYIEALDSDRQVLRTDWEHDAESA
jgi:hypothetical protein